MVLVAALLLELGNVFLPLVEVLVVRPEVRVLGVDDHVRHDLQSLFQVHLFDRHHLLPLGHLDSDPRNPASNMKKAIKSDERFTFDGLKNYYVDLNCF